LWIAEVNVDFGPQREATMIRKFLSPIPGQGFNRIKPSSASPTDEEKVKLFGTLIAYSGTYVLDRDKVTHKIDVSWNQSWTGDEQVRFYKLEGKRLTITSAINKSPRDGREGRVIVMLRKVQ
jgi:Lipocalin-like domain